MRIWLFKKVMAVLFCLIPRKDIPMVLVRVREIRERDERLKGSEGFGWVVAALEKRLPKIR